MTQYEQITELAKAHYIGKIKPIVVKLDKVFFQETITIVEPFNRVTGLNESYSIISGFNGPVVFLKHRNNNNIVARLWNELTLEDLVKVLHILEKKYQITKA